MRAFCAARGWRFVAVGVALSLWANMPLLAQDAKPDSTHAFTDTTTYESHPIRPRVIAMGMVISATWTQALGVPEGWPRTWEGYGSRLGDQVGFGVTEESVRYGLQAVIPWRSPVLECADARAGRPWRARGLAATRCGLRGTFVAQNSAGQSRPNVPLLGAIVTASAVSLLWRPERKAARKGQLFVLTRVGIVTGATVFNRGVQAWRAR